MSTRDELRDELRDAVVEAARAMSRDMLVVARLPETRSNVVAAEVVMMRSITRVVAAVDALEAHERGSET